MEEIKGSTGNKLADGIAGAGTTGLIVEGTGAESGSSSGGEGTEGKTPEQVEAERVATEKAASETATAAAAAGGSEGNEGATEEEKQIAEIADKKPEERTEEEDTLLSTHYDTMATGINEKPEADRTTEEVTFLTDYNEAVRKETFIFKFSERYGLSTDTTEDTEEALFAAGDKLRDTTLLEGADGLLNQNPLLKELYEHQKAGKSLDTFKLKHQGNKYTDIAIAEDNLEQQEAVYRESLVSKGIGKEEVEDLVTLAKSGEKLLERSKAGLEAMKLAQDNSVQMALEAENIQLQAAVKQQETVNKEVDTLIQGGKLLGHVIPQNELNQFSDYLNKETVKLKDGRAVTQVSYDWSQLTTEQLLFLDRIVQLDFKMPGVGGTKIKIGNKRIIKFGESKVKSPKLGGEGSGSGNSNGTPSFVKDGNIRSLFTNE
ncbi:hypothetical protein LCGC14_0245430 [marine sediment metagenome]|uniref:Uncharacterized protein n=1 Tax=marine sediment metagenome TaxID=412755 RepID=A0A0F9UMB4_9ZZZZ